MSEQQSRTNDPHLFPYEKGVFVSYAWGGESERIVIELESAFTARGIRILRDKRDLAYRGSINAFEQRLGEALCVILVISDKYLRSEHCMYELLEVDEKRGLRDRIFPIVLPDAQIYEAVHRMRYVDYWDNETRQLDLAIKQRDGVTTDLDSIMSELKKYKRIRENFDRLISLVSDMNTLTPDIHKQDDFQILIDAVEKELSSSQPDSSIPVSTERSQEKQILNRRLDPAMPGELVEVPRDSLPKGQVDTRPRLTRKLSNLSPAVLATLFVGVLAAIATIVGALIQIAPFVVAYLNSTPVATSATPVCITEKDILVRLYVLKGDERIFTIAPSGRIDLGPDETVDLDVNFQSVFGQPIPTLECTWDNANSQDITSPTEGVLLHTSGCTVDYKSGHSATKITDTLSLQVSQASCPSPLSYAFFIFPK